MAVRLILGRAGAGKTRRCLDDIRQELARHRTDGPRLILLVPEQAALQSERLLLSLTEGVTLGRCEVLSFRRLAQRIFAESDAPIPTPLSPLGRQMAIRYLLSEHRSSFKEFGRVADRGGFIAELSSALSELFRESVSIEKLDACAAIAEAEDPAGHARLHDLALLYRHYCNYLGDDRVDPDGVLALARAQMSNASWLRGARIWVDGFASFTRQQIETLIALAGISTSVDIAILLDPQYGVATDENVADNESKIDATDLFAKTRATMADLLRSCAEAAVTVEPPIRLLKPPSRFAYSPDLLRLEQTLFTQPGTTDDEPATLPEATTVETAQLVVAPDLRTEARAAARAIIDLTRRETDPMRYRDIAILVRDLEPYHDLLSAELYRHGIPFFIDRRRPTYHHPLVQLIRGLVGLVGGASFESSIIAILKSGMTRLDRRDVDSLENYILAYGMISAAQWDAEWTRKPPGFRNKRTMAAREEAKRIDAARRMLRSMVGDWWPGTSSKPESISDSGATGSSPASPHNVGRVSPATTARDAEAGKTRPTKGAAGQLDASASASKTSDQANHPPQAQALTPPKTCGDWTMQLYAVLERLSVTATLDRWCTDAEARNDLDEASEHEQIWSSTIDLLDELVAALGDTTMRARSFRETIEAGLGELTLGLVPPTLDQVIVGTIERGRQPPDLRAAFILGMADGLWPGRITESALLGDDERALMENNGAALGRSRIERLREERLLAYVAATRASDVLWISRPAHGADGREAQPSLYWSNFRAALGDGVIRRASTDGIAAISTVADLAGNLTALWHRRLAGGSTESVIPHRRTGETPVPQDSQLRTEPDGETAALFEWVRRQSNARLRNRVSAALKALVPPSDAILTKDATRALWQTPHESSVTRLETFAKCPFRHYAAYGLELDERELHELSAPRWGLYYHRVLEQFVNELIESGNTLHDMTEPAIEQRVTQLCTDVLPEFIDELNLDESQQRELSERGKRALPTFLYGHRKTVGATRLAPHKTERAFGRDNDWPALKLSTKEGDVLIRGKIDRIDLLAESSAQLAIVFDYKRKLRRAPALHEIYHGLALQLVAYLLVLRQHAGDIEPGAIQPAGAMLLPLEWQFDRVKHPDEADEESFDPFKKTRPRGLIDFDALGQIDPSIINDNKSVAFAAAAKNDGGISNYNRSDALRSGELATVLKFVQQKMVELCESWLSGNILVRPARLGRDLPCSHCPYRSVCRFEYILGRVRDCPTINKEDAVNRMKADVTPNEDTDE